MPPKQDLKLPPLKYLLSGLCAFLVLSFLSAREHSDKLGGSGRIGSSGGQVDKSTGAYVPVRKEKSDYDEWSGSSAVSLPFLSTSVFSS